MATIKAIRNYATSAISSSAAFASETRDIAKPINDLATAPHPGKVTEIPNRSEAKTQTHLLAKPDVLTEVHPSSKADKPHKKESAKSVITSVSAQRAISYIRSTSNHARIANAGTGNANTGREHNFNTGNAHSVDMESITNNVTDTNNTKSLANNNAKTYRSEVIDTAKEIATLSAKNIVPDTPAAPKLRNDIPVSAPAQPAIALVECTSISFICQALRHRGKWCLRVLSGPMAVSIIRNSSVARLYWEKLRFKQSIIGFIDHPCLRDSP